MLTIKENGVPEYIEHGVYMHRHVLWWSLHISPVPVLPTRGYYYYLRLFNTVGASSQCY